MFVENYTLLKHHTILNYELQVVLNTKLERKKLLFAFLRQIYDIAYDLSCLCSIANSMLFFSDYKQLL